MKKKTNENDSIFVRQSKKEILEMQAAAKLYFSSAPNIDAVIYILNIIIIIITLNFENDFMKIVELIIGIGLLIVNSLINENRNKGAKIREYVDSILYGLECDITEEEIRKLVLVQKKKHKSLIATYCNNTGEDKIRGVKNWYSDYSDKDRLGEILHCQKENIYYDEEITQKHYLKYIIAVEIIVLLITILLSIKYDILTGIIATFDLITINSSKIISIIKFKFTTGGINSYIKRCQNNPNKEDIKYIQKYINDRRKLNIDIPNFIHNILSNELHNDYKFIRKGK